MPWAEVKWRDKGEVTETRNKKVQAGQKARTGVSIEKSLSLTQVNTGQVTSTVPEELAGP